jgi:hypothetical protein
MPWVYVTQGIFVLHVTDFAKRGPPPCFMNCARMWWMRKQKRAVFVTWVLTWKSSGG